MPRQQTTKKASAKPAKAAAAGSPPAPVSQEASAPAIPYPLSAAAEEESETAESPEPTGTQRVTDDKGNLKLPDPHLPGKDQKKKPAKADKPAPVKEKTHDPQPRNDVHVTSAHIVETLAQNNAELRMARLKILSRTNRDVAWLLDAFETLVQNG